MALKGRDVLSAGRNCVNSGRRHCLPVRSIYRCKSSVVFPWDITLDKDVGRRVLSGVDLSVVRALGFQPFCELFITNLLRCELVRFCPV